MAERSFRKATSAIDGDIWSMALRPMGLRYHEGEAREVIRRMNWLRESVTYQAIYEEGRDYGRLEGERRLLLCLGTAKLGPPPPYIRAAIAAIDNASQLEQMGLTLFQPDSTWESPAASLGRR
jgi:hypothetical protein